MAADREALRRDLLERVLCLVDRCEGAAAAFAARGLELESLFTRADLPV